MKFDKDAFMQFMDWLREPPSLLEQRNQRKRMLVQAGRRNISVEAINTNFESWGVEDVARYLKCSPRHIRNLVSEGKIPFAKVGRRLVFSPERTREWLQKGGTR